MEKTVWRSLRLRRLFVSLLAVFLVAVAALPGAAALAEETTYYATWDQYKASGQPATTWNNVADAMDAVFDRAEEVFAAGDPDEAYKWVNNGYYGYYEVTGFERVTLGYISGARKSQVELAFSAAKSVCKKKGTADELHEALVTLRGMIHEDANKLDGVSDDSSETEDTGSTGTGAGTSAAAATFAACFSIILREGFEAILIVGAIIAYLNKQSETRQERRRKTRPVVIGSILGIVFSFVLAAVLNAVKLANSASQEIIEGVTALTAVVVLYYVSNWMLSKSETDAWNSYIKSKAEAGAKNGSMFALAFTAFLAVFREGAEVVLFYQPMLAGDNISSVWAGFIVGCFVLVFVYLAIHLLSVRIPLKPFFTATSVLMFIMSVSFLGAGIKELIEGDVFLMVSPEWLSWIPQNDLMDVLGIYPTLQTLVPQLILIVITVIIFVRTQKKNQKIHEEAEARRAEELAREEAARKKEADEALTAKIREVVLQVLAEQAGSDKQ